MLILNNGERSKMSPSYQTNSYKTRYKKKYSLIIYINLLRFFDLYNLIYFIIIAFINYKKMHNIIKC